MSYHLTAGTHNLETAGLSLAAASGKLIACYAKWDADQTGAHNSANVIFSLTSQNDLLDGYMRITVTTTPLLSARISGNGTQSAAFSSSTWVDGSWTLVALYYEAFDGGGLKAAYMWRGAAANQVNSATANLTQTAAWVRLRLGQALASTSSLSYFKGKLAEAAVWNAPGNLAAAQSIVTHLETKTANNADCPVAPTHYWPLNTDAVATIGGVDLTVTGAANDADHPSLIGFSSAFKPRVRMLF